MRLREHYDWIVLGSHPGALLSAGLASRLGFAVLILPTAAPTLGLISTPSGNYLDPETNYLLGLGKSDSGMGLVYDCLTRLGALTPETIQQNLQWNIPQVLTPTARLDFASNERMLIELKRELGKHASTRIGLVHHLEKTEKEYLSFWTRLPKRLTLESTKKPKSPDPQTLSELRRKLLRQVKNESKSVHNWISQRKQISDLSISLQREDLCEVFQGLWYWTTLRMSDNPTLFDILHILSLSRAGASFRGGMTAYRQFLLNAAKNHGAHVIDQVECRRLFVERNRFAGVQIATKGSMIAGSAGILGCTMERVHSRITFTGRSWLDPRKRSVKPIGWKFTIALTVNKEVIPIGIKSRSVWQEKDAPFLEMEVVDPSDYSTHVSRGKVKIIYLRTMLPFTDESLKLDFQRLIASRMLRQATEVMPFLQEHLLQIYPDFRSPVGSKDLTEIYGFPNLSSIPDNLYVYSSKGMGSTTGIDGLFISSDVSYPSFGGHGSTIAALEAVAWLSHRFGLQGPFVDSGPSSLPRK